MGVSEYGLQQEQGPYKTVAQIWEEAAQQGSKYRTLTAKHRYNIVKDAAGDNFISKSDLKKVKTLGKGSFGTGKQALATPPLKLQLECCNLSLLCSCSAAHCS